MHGVEHCKILFIKPNLIIYIHQVLQLTDKLYKLYSQENI
jgi:hypothetical protein